MDAQLKYFSLFSGIGGFEIGIEKAFNYKRKSEDGGPEKGRDRDSDERGILPCDRRIETPLCVGCSEIDRYARAIYRRHFPDVENFGDATTLDVSRLPDFDLLTAGFPCQAFSRAGKRQGVMDARGTLFFEIARVLEHKRPRYFLLENVEGLLDTQFRETLITIVRIFTDIGYTVAWQLLNTSHYGLPQHRERIFFAGCLGEFGRPEIFPISEGNRGNQKAESDEPFEGEAISSTIDSRYGALRNCGESYIHYVRYSESQQYRTYMADGLSPCLQSETSFDKWNIEFDENTIRVLTEIECERLQGFPDNWTKYGIDENGREIEISKTQRYATIGRSVSTNVIEKIIGKWFLERRLGEV